MNFGLLNYIQINSISQIFLDALMNHMNRFVNIGIEGVSDDTIDEFWDCS